MRHTLRPQIHLAARLGIEPRLKDLESIVLPLNYLAVKDWGDVRDSHSYLTPSQGVVLL